MKVKIAPWLLAVVVLVVLFGGIALSDQLGWWVTTNQKTPATIKTGAYAGQSDPMDIRGSSYFSDIAKTFDVPLADLADAFQITTSQAQNFQCKSLETLAIGEPGQDIGTSSIRTFVAFYIGWKPDQFTVGALPQSAVQVLLAKGRLSAEARAYLAG